MTNAWSLLYDEVLKMKTDHCFDEMPENIANEFTEAFGDVNINLDTITGCKMKDLTNDNGFWKLLGYYWLFLFSHFQSVRQHKF